MVNAEITDEDRQAAEGATDEAIRRQDEGEHMGVENAYAQAIANARAAGREEAAVLLDGMSANLEKHADEAWPKYPVISGHDRDSAGVYKHGAKRIRALMETKP